MIDTFNEILNRTWAHLYAGITLYLPSLIVALLVVAIAWMIAHFGRFLVTRLVSGRAFDRFLTTTGLSNIFRPQGDLRTGPLVARAVFWLLMLGGILSAISVFQTQWTQMIVEDIVLLLPKALTAAVIVIVGIWLGLYLSRTTLLWASEEQLPAPRRWAAVVRVVVLFTAVVVASDVLRFAPSVFYAAFIILVGGATLAAAIAFGLGGQDAVRRWMSRGGSDAGAPDGKEDDVSIWRHL